MKKKKKTATKQKEFTSNKPLVFDPPELMEVWDVRGYKYEDYVYAYIPDRSCPVILEDRATYHCAEIEE